jgi:hypothetical protein
VATLLSEADGRLSDAELSRLSALIAGTKSEEGSGSHD